MIKSVCLNDDCKKIVSKPHCERKRGKGKYCSISCSNVMRWKKQKDKKTVYNWWQDSYNLGCKVSIHLLNKARNKNKKTDDVIFINGKFR